MKTKYGLFAITLFLSSCASGFGQGSRMVDGEGNNYVKLLKYVDGVINKNEGKEIEVNNQFNGIRITNDVLLELKETSSQYGWGMGSHIENGKVLILLYLLRKDGILFIICNNEEYILRMIFYRINTSSTPVSVFGEVEVFGGENMQVLTNVICVAKNDRMKEFIEPIKAWKIDFEENMVREIVGRQIMVRTRRD